ncbi:hypothetical protein OOK31_32730 [Streptomyces sp. NBC_00249]|uniref:hypothetical protein n=1 Tax=Streptomyces sp. NBC_00249 TaxID=2975690 RepID=UPI00224E3274|nr:hypothetical protein [Streptomyces sp. NBC_00249]MCX5198598.1 hypothetical protein [Streptomyces sp. NBC_00249]
MFLSPRVYVGWLVYQYYDQGAPYAYGMYPMRPPVQVPGFSSPVAVHLMTAEASAFSPKERALIDEYVRIAQENDEEVQALLSAEADGQRRSRRTTGFRGCGRRCRRKRWWR